MEGGGLLPLCAKSRRQASSREEATPAGASPIFAIVPALSDCRRLSDTARRQSASPARPNDRQLYRRLRQICGVR
jgi:hypothetical protein